MAFTAEQRRDIRHYLGFPDVFRGANSRLEDAMDVIGGRPEVVEQVEAILAEIAAVIAALSPSSSSGLHTRAGIRKVDEIEFFGDSGRGNVAAMEMRNLGRQWVGRLSIVMGVPIVHDIFGSTGYVDDSWGGRAFQVGGLIPLG